LPCWSVRSTKVAFEKVAYKPAHLELLTAALQEMGYEVLRNGATLKIWPKNTVANAANTIAYGGGILQIPSPLKDRLTLDRVKEAYARQAVRLHAKRNGWLLQEIGGREFIAERR
jgi:hypothetical protein